MRHGSLFSGIGGFDLAAEWMGWDNVFHCEWNNYGQNILKQYWPNAISYKDITQTDFAIHRGGIDVLTGGFPCQPFSVAGERKGTEDDRYLWPEMLRAIREIQPIWVVPENVPGIINWSKGVVFEQVQADLETSGYEILPVLLPACGLEGDHRRERIWILAHAKHGTDCPFRGKEEKKNRIQKQREQAGFSRKPSRTNTSFSTNNRSERNEGDIEKKIQKLQGIQRGEDGGGIAVFGERSDLFTPILCRSYNGIPSGMDRIKALGNAIVPQIAFELFKTIEDYEKMQNM